VVLHELGHFLPARYFGTRVEKFYLFFDPWFSLFKKKKGDRVRHRLAALRRLREDQRHGGREHGQGPAREAGPSLGNSAASPRGSA
jgi:regulator of sigma E protease